MKKHLFTWILLFTGCQLLAAWAERQDIQTRKSSQINDKVRLTEEELRLYNLITAYRSANGLPQIPLSAALTTVAHFHVRDLDANHPDTGRCNMHSWSAKGRWQACCYTPDHAQKERMWSKPRELTTYKGNGYEIAAGGSGKITADQALTLWKGHPPHNEVIVNKGIWMAKWNAIGIGIYNKYAVVWFGRDTDQEGEPARPSTR